MKTLSADRLLTCDASGNASVRRAGMDAELGAIDDASVVFDEHAVHWIGKAAARPECFPQPFAHVPLVTPGLVDAHTHAAWMGSRHAEYLQRLAGASYQEIAAAGGGIVATHAAVTAASETEVFDQLCARLRRMASLGVTTVEVKSGYGLTPEGELKQLRAIHRAAHTPGLPRVVSTYLALHSLPPEVRAQADKTAASAQYVHTMTGDLLNEIAAQGLADFVDAYVDQGAFSAADARRLAERAQALGLGIRLHCGQFADVGGLAVAAEYQAASVDHMEHAAAADCARLAAAGTSIVLLPIASYTLRQSPPPIEVFRRAGLQLVVASDANPGTAPSESLPLAMAMAVRDYGLTLAEAWLGATVHAARSLRRPGQSSAAGTLAVGGAADLVAWDLPSEACILQPWGTQRTRGVWRDGVQIA